ncbi:MAG: VOC family protein [Candidatus Hodarchaeales archaeon]
MGNSDELILRKLSQVLSKLDRIESFIYPTYLRLVSDKSVMIPTISVSEVINYVACNYGVEDARRFKAYLHECGIEGEITIREFYTLFERFMYFSDSDGNLIEGDD